MTEPQSLPEPPAARLVVDDGELRELCERWRGAPALAVDTEFIRTRTFFPRLGLVQVADPESIVLLDAVALSDWEPLVEVLTLPDVLKVLHSPSEDLELFAHVFGRLPEPFTDTQIAATLAGRGGMPGYSRMVEELFGVGLPKGQQRSDWLKRPLSSSQVRYAGLDVAYLLPAWEMLEEQLDDLGRLSWLEEEVDRLVGQAESKNDPMVIYQRLWRSNLSDEQSGALLELVTWREEVARKRDLPRRFVVGDDVLLEMARRLPRSVDALRDFDSLGDGQRRRLGPELVDIVAASEARDTSVERRDATKVSKGDLKRVRGSLEQIAEELDVPSEFLASKRALEKLVRRVDGDEAPVDVPPELQGWRWDRFGDRLVEAI